MAALQERLDEFKKSFESGAPPYNAPHEAIETMHRATAELTATGIEQRALKVGDRAPNFTLFNQDHIDDKFPEFSNNNLTWAIRGRDDKGSEAVNHSIRILGRRGTMNVDLVLDPEQYASVLPEFNTLLGSFEFRQGNRYLDFSAGDKVAAYGLTALIAGGAGAVTAKTGLLIVKRRTFPTADVK